MGQHDNIKHKQQALYRMYSDSGSLLYVGITCNPSRRFERHQGDKEWWDDVARIELEQFPNRGAVLAAERAAIANEKPLHNIRMNGNGATTSTLPAVDTNQTDGLVGRYFHSWREQEEDDDASHVTLRNGRVLVWQGRVVERIEISLYLIELFSWWDGEPNGQQLADTNSMQLWTFYESALEMQAALGCRDTTEYRELCGRECTHVAWCLGITTICSHCADSYAVSAEIVWRGGRPDEQETLAALNKAKSRKW